jgi:hypothetical protein
MYVPWNNCYLEPVSMRIDVQHASPLWEDFMCCSFYSSEVRYMSMWNRWKATVSWHPPSEAISSQITVALHQQLSHKQQINLPLRNIFTTAICKLWDRPADHVLLFCLFLTRNLWPFHRKTKPRTPWESSRLVCYILRLLSWLTSPFSLARYEMPN